MSTIDDRVVAMSFENSKFESGVHQSLGTLQKLKASLNFSGSTKGLDDIENRASHLNLSGITNSLDSISHRFSGLGLIAGGAFAAIGARAAAAGATMIKSLTIDPIVAGFHNYETQINAVQTILANTGLKGKAGINQVNSALAQLNTYANQTVFNFSEMARNIGTFTAAGVDLKTATASIKGIANLSALSGSSSEQAASAMYQLSQAIAAGRVNLQDWNSVVNAGIGGSVFQRALANTAEAMGTLKKGAVESVGPMHQLQINGESFRNAISTRGNAKTWLTSDVLTKTLEQFTGDMKASQLAAEGFNASQIKAIQAQGQTALHAATNIKTLSQLTQALKEEVATAWAAIFKTIFGNLGQSTTLFSKLHIVIENALTNPIYNFNKLLQQWAKLGGRTDLLNGIKNAFKDLEAILKPIQQAFREVFPPETAQHLADLTKRFEEFTARLKIGSGTAGEIRRTFAGFFAILDIGKKVVVEVFHILGDLFGVASKGSGGFLHLTAVIGDWLVALDKSLKTGQGFLGFLGNMGSLLAAPVRLIEALKNTLLNLFTGFDPKAANGLGSALNNLKTTIGPLGNVMDIARNAWNKFLGILDHVKNTLTPVINDIVNGFKNFGHTLASAFQGADFSNILRVINTGLLGGILILVRNFFKKGLSIDIGGGLLGHVSEVFELLTGHLKAMQQNVQADTLLKIAAAIGILSLAVLGLSLIDPKRLQNSLGGLAIAFGELIGAMAILTKINGVLGAIKIPVIAAGLIALAVAVDLLVLAVAGLSRLSWEQLAKGLTGVAGLLTAISVAAIPLSANSAGLIRAGAGIAIISVAMNIMALAVRQFASMDLAGIGKGLFAVGASLITISQASQLFPPGMVALGGALILFGIGLHSIGGAVREFGSLNLKVIGTGLLGIGGALVVISRAMELMPPGIAVQAAGLILVSIALQGIGRAIKNMGGLSMAALAKGLLGVAGALGIFAVALGEMETALPGAGALLVASAAMRLLVPALQALGSMSIGDLVKGLLGLGAALVVLGLAGVALEPTAPALLALGVAILAIGGGFALVGAGVLAVSTALSLIAVSGPAAIAIIIGALVKFTQAIPQFVTGFVNGLLTMAQKLAEVAPQMVAAIGKIIIAMSEAIVTAMPGLVKAFGAIVQGMVTAIEQNLPKLIHMGLRMLVALLSGIANNIGAVTTQAVNVIINFVNALANNAGRLVSSGAHALARFLGGIASNAFTIVNSAVNVIAKFVTALGSQNNVNKLINAGAALVIHVLRGLGNSRNINNIINAGVDLVANLISGLARGTVRFAGRAFDIIIKFLNDLGTVIRTKAPKLIAAFVKLGGDIVAGIGQGMLDAAKNLALAPVHVIGGILDDVLGAAQNKVQSHSPSRVYMGLGSDMMAGLAIGIDDGSKLAVNSVKRSMQTIGNAMAQGIGSALTVSRKIAAQPLKISPITDPKKIAELKKVQDLLDKGFYGPAGSLVLPKKTIHIAKDISPETAANTVTGPATPAGVASVTFIQQNTSPSSLSELEIYRQTKNQLSQARAALMVNPA